MKNSKVFIGSYFALLIFGVFSSFIKDVFSTEILVGAYGASAAIVFNSPKDDISSYRNISRGYLISCLIGIFFNFLISSNYNTLKVALAVSVAIYSMRVLKIFHPAGGAIALLSTTYQYTTPLDLVKYFIGTSIVGPSLFLLIVLVVRKNKLLSLK